MSAQEIIAELHNLDAEGIRLVKAKVDELMDSSAQRAPIQASPSEKESLNAFLLRIAGTANGLPADLAENHDHYLYGTSKRGSSLHPVILSRHDSASGRNHDTSGWEDKV